MAAMYTTSYTSYTTTASSFDYDGSGADGSMNGYYYVPHQNQYWQYDEWSGEFYKEAVRIHKNLLLFFKEVAPEMHAPEVIQQKLDELQQEMSKHVRFEFIRIQGSVKYQELFI